METFWFGNKWSDELLIHHYQGLMNGLYRRDRSAFELWAWQAGVDRGNALYGEG